MSARLAITMMSAASTAQPAIQPTQGPNALGGPGERRAAVRVGLVEVVERRRDEEHRDERDENDRRRVDADARDERDAAEHGRQAVARSRRGDADDHAREERRACPRAGPSPPLHPARAPQPCALPGVEFGRSSQARRSRATRRWRARRDLDLAAAASRSAAAPPPGPSSSGGSGSAGGGAAGAALADCTNAMRSCARSRRSASISSGGASGSSSSTMPASASIASRACSRSACSGLATPRRIAAWLASITAVCASRSRGRSVQQLLRPARRGCRRRPDPQPRAASCASAASTDSRVTRTWSANSSSSVAPASSAAIERCAELPWSSMRSQRLEVGLEPERGDLGRRVGELRAHALGRRHRGHAALVVDQLAREPEADRAPHVLLDVAAAQLGQRLALVDGAQAARRERVGVGHHGQRLAHVGERVGVAQLDRPVGLVRAHAPPDLGVLADRAGVDEPAHEACRSRPSRRTARGCRSAGTCA